MLLLMLVSIFEVFVVGCVVVAPTQSAYLTNIINAMGLG
jgi:hypothetical protein